MPYFEIYPIENSANKISKQLDAVLKEKPHMYTKTKQRYKQLALNLLESIDKITSILEEDSLAYIDSDEFTKFRSSGVDISDVSAALDRTRSKFEAYEEFTSKSSPSASKHTFLRYLEVLSDASQHDFGYIEVNECADLLYRWFNARFIENGSFKYNINQLPSWICSIVLLYGKYQSNHQIARYLSMFNKWIESLDTGSVNWAVPYEVHKLTKNINPDDYTMTAVVIGDILMDEYLYKLTADQSPDILCTLESYPVATLAKTHNPDLADMIRTRIVRRNQLVEYVGLVTSERS